MHKSELAALDRKITAELIPTYEVPDDRMGVNHDENNGTENKQEQSQQPYTKVNAETTVKTVNVHTTDTPQGHKPSMVAEPSLSYVGKCSAFSDSTFRNLIILNRQIRL